MPSWPRPIALAAVLVLALLAGGALARAWAAWRGDGGPPTHAAALPVVRARSASPGLVPLIPPDAGRTVVDIVRPGRPPRLLVLPRIARLADLLAAAGLPPDLPVDGVHDARTRLPPGARLVLTASGPSWLTCMPAPRRLRLGLPLDVNGDAAADLERLPGIGPVLAARIVADRERRGPYRSLEALARVPGIGPATVVRIRSRVMVITQSTCAAEQR